jgi:hypothetical protein
MITNPIKIAGIVCLTVLINSCMITYSVKSKYDRPIGYQSNYYKADSVKKTDNHLVYYCNGHFASSNKSLRDGFKVLKIKFDLDDMDDYRGIDFDSLLKVWPEPNDENTWKPIPNRYEGYKWDSTCNAYLRNNHYSIYVLNLNTVSYKDYGQFTLTIEHKKPKNKKKKKIYPIQQNEKKVTLMPDSVHFESYCLNNNWNCCPITKDINKYKKIPQIWDSLAINSNGVATQWSDFFSGKTMTFSYVHEENDTLMVDMMTLYVRNEGMRTSGYQLLYILTVPLDIILFPIELIMVLNDLT